MEFDLQIILLVKFHETKESFDIIMKGLLKLIDVAFNILMLCGFNVRTKPLNIEFIKSIFD